MKNSRFILKIIHSNSEEKVSIQSAILIGRDEEMDVRLEEPSVSSKHAKIFIEQNSAYIEDFGSTNGTFVNGAPVKSKTKLKNNDIVTIGSCKCIFFDTDEKTKKYLTVCTSQDAQKHHIKIVVANKKLSSQDVMQKRKDQLAVATDLGISSFANHGITTSSVFFQQEVSGDYVSEISVLPTKRKDILSLWVTKESQVLQKIKVPLNHEAYYASKSLRLALCLPILLFILDSVQFKTTDCSFIVATLLKLIYAFGGFTITGILLGIAFIVSGLVLQVKAQQVNIYHQEIVL